MADPTQFNDGVQIHGTDDKVQLEVRGPAAQSQPLQEWQDPSGETLAQVTADGRLEVGDDQGPPSALLEANKDVDVDNDVIKQGFQTRGVLSGTLDQPETWSVQEAELSGSGGVSGIQAAQRVKLVQNNTGDASAADLRASDVEAVNQQGTSGTPVGQMAAVHGRVTNAPNAHLNNATAVEAHVANEGTVDQASGVKVDTPANTGTINKLHGIKVEDQTQGSTENYAIHTGQGQVHFGDVVEVKAQSATPAVPPADHVQVYPKADGRLYIQNASGQEYDLTDTGNYQTIQENGTNQTQRPKLNLINGPNVTLTMEDDGTNERTNVTIAAAGASLNLGISATKTISGGVISAGTDKNLVIAAESGTADDLDTINGTSEGDIIAIRADVGNTITVVDGTGNIQLHNNTNMVISETDTLLLVNVDGTNLVQPVDQNSGGGGSSVEALVEVAADNSSHIGTPDFLRKFTDGETDDWTVVENTSPNVTVTKKASKLSIFHPGGDPSRELHGVVWSFSPTGDFYFDAAFRYAGNYDNYQQSGLIASTSNVWGTGTQTLITWRWANVLEMHNWSNWDSLVSSTNQSFGGRLPVWGPLFYMRLQYTASSGLWEASLSADGISWIPYLTRTNSFSTAYIGFVLTTSGGSQKFIKTYEYVAAYNGTP